ncbi:MAG: hypothetical protein ABJA11_11000 [Pseudolysinimonas sp.]
MSKAKKRPDAAAEVIDKLSPHVEPPPMSRPLLSPPYAFPIPFGEPPAEPVKLVDGEIPWELRDGE